MSDIRVDEILPLTAPLKGDSTTIILQDSQTRRVSIQSLSAIIANAVPSDTPVGQVSFFATTSAPNGWIQCKGDKLDIVGEFNELYKVIGHTFTDIINPLVDKSKYFYAPDLRGYFIRGLDNGAGVDEDTTRKLGSKQDDSIEKHRHNIVGNSGGSNNVVDILGSGGEKNVKFVNTDSFGGAETRPKNVALLACIKYSAAKGPATPVASASSTFTGIDISNESSALGSAKELKFTGNVDVSRIGDVATINVKSSGSSGRPNILGFPIYRGGYNIGAITDEPSILGWKQMGKAEWNFIDSSASVFFSPAQKCRFNNYYLFDNTELKIVKTIFSKWWNCVLLDDGTLWISGSIYADNRIGAVDWEYKNNTSGFVKIKTDKKFDDFDILSHTTVSSGEAYISFAAIEKETRNLYTWGNNVVGQLGRIKSVKPTSDPTLVNINLNKKIRQIAFSGSVGASGINNTAKLLVLYDDDTLYSCGYNKDGQLATGDKSDKDSLTQCRKSANTLVSDAKRIVVGAYGTIQNSAYISTADELYVCGDNSSGQIGNNTKNQSSFFIKSQIEESVEDVVVCGFSGATCSFLALGKSGKMYSWGNNKQGQLGQGNLTQISKPTLVKSMEKVSIQKIYGVDCADEYYAFACLGVNGEVYMAGNDVPFAPKFTLATNSTYFTRINIKKVVDLVISYKYVNMLAEDGKVYEFGTKTDGASIFPREIII